MMCKRAARSRAVAALSMLAAGVLTAMAAAPPAVAMSGPGGRVVLVAPMSERSGMKDCVRGKFCFWEDENFWGWRLSTTGSVPYVGDFMNDKMSSLYNNTDYWVTVYRDANYVDCMFWTYPRRAYSALGDEFNDQASSVLLTTTAPETC
ncbi:peptidase inhibitor family I36 protein [Streptomyces clavuligerus]|uniref:Inhibitor_I36 domain-containing protein n=1 Tax=Streptomyces clavuligerus TaxID=1901 RepID=B5GLX3_STRCL|nr:peptidase inhibitor family I36 protein [Streptomyces clavuligerus]EDY47319.1 hypothetical protein SSCG_00347 [Streptomyces clavuligerus]EFG04979.1 Inhibitor_I36 domain-containing protein [Streptomyces clavuligerus]MBY6306594.1 peptidase inhibitor family I36 protein [Streptomyces clavuligerus]QCS10799.1 hypothetical protein CRV15_35395 [Streptomyces clavuligerus]QPJ97166.1 hypothetical protein GE265_29090 [Streptomyces clavuligerus]